MKGKDIRYKKYERKDTRKTKQAGDFYINTLNSIAALIFLCLVAYACRSGM